MKQTQQSFHGHGWSLPGGRGQLAGIILPGEGSEHISMGAKLHRQSTVLLVRCAKTHTESLVGAQPKHSPVNTQGRGGTGSGAHLTHSMWLLTHYPAKKTGKEHPVGHLTPWNSINRPSGVGACSTWALQREQGIGQSPGGAPLSVSHSGSHPTHTAFSLLHCWNLPTWLPGCCPLSSHPCPQWQQRAYDHRA